MQTVKDGFFTIGTNFKPYSLIPAHQGTSSGSCKTMTFFKLNDCIRKAIPRNHTDVCRVFKFAIETVIRHQNHPPIRPFIFVDSSGRSINEIREYAAMQVGEFPPNQQFTMKSVANNPLYFFAANSNTAGWVGEALHASLFPQYRDSLTAFRYKLHNFELLLRY